MASLEKALKAAIFDLLKNDTDVSNIVGTKIFDTRVPPGPSPPWVRYYIVTETALNDFMEASPIGYRVPITVDCAALGEVLHRGRDRVERFRRAGSHRLSGANNGGLRSLGRGRDGRRDACRACFRCAGWSVRND